MTKTASKHTSGPWRVDFATGRILAQAPAYPSYEDRCIAELGESLAFSQQERAANARLIAAAPEMYELLDEIAENDCATQPGTDADMMLEWAVEARRIKAEIDREKE